MYQKALGSLTQTQKDRIKVLVEATLELTEEQRLIVNRRVRDMAEKAFGVDVALYSDFAPKLVKSADGSWPELKPDSFNVADYLGRPDNIPAGVVDAVAGGWKIPLMSGNAAASTPSASSTTPAPEPPKAAEKTTFHLVLKSFPPEAKIKLIKEVKGLLNIGLKEAKDQVESVAKTPLVLFKNLPKEDAEAKMKKLKDAGGVAELE